jgi:uncharacterized protein (TIGR02145 family)
MNLEPINLEKYKVLGALFLAFCIASMFLSCKKEFLNPYDSETPGDSWMPSQFNLNITGNNSVELSWSQANTHIDGFTIIKRKNMIDEVFEIDKNTLKFTDSLVINPSLGETCAEVSYLIYARAGEQKSNLLILSEKLLFPRPYSSDAGSDIEAETIDIQSLETSLNANIPGLFATGEWSVVAGLDGRFGDIYSPTSSFTGVLGQKYTLAWTITTSCGVSITDYVVVSMPYEIPGLAVADNDGNIYSIKTIGSQVWMTQNLKTSKYRNGSPIPNVTNNHDWGSVGYGAWCNYNNDSNYDSLEGKMYNRYTVVDSRGLCPLGWHVPDDADWNQLINFLGGGAVAGYKMKSILGWEDRIPEGTSGNGDNSSGFNGLPGGLRGTSYDNNYLPGIFLGFGSVGSWWSSTESNWGVAGSRGKYFNLTQYDNIVYSDDTPEWYGLFIRCLKD